MGKVIYDKNREKRTIEDIKLETEIFNITPELFNPHRFMILNALLRHEVLDFNELKYGIHAKSDGHLASHLRALENTDLIEYIKEFSDRRPKTFYRLTRKGKDEILKLARILKTSLYDIDSIQYAS
jgi:DNA-binding HxlR family transcriptional regulator